MQFGDLGARKARAQMELISNSSRDSSTYLNRMFCGSWMNSM